MCQKCKLGMGVGQYILELFIFSRKCFYGAKWNYNTHLFIREEYQGIALPGSYKNTFWNIQVDFSETL